MGKRDEKSGKKITDLVDKNTIPFDEWLEEKYKSTDTEKTVVIIPQEYFGRLDWLRELRKRREEEKRRAKKS